MKFHDADIGELVRAVRELMAPPQPNRRKIGFQLALISGKAVGRVRIAV